ncbi:MAG: right-handed parallel beta-helix repeat-containing protein [Clostridia bacterium]|nr:right-handed parallel beta-helix repeat-containing protein [Clostridia bacterium]
MKKNKILAGVMIGTILAGLFGLTACGEPPHTHTYTTHYVVKTVDSQEKAYTYTKCDCGTETELTLIENAVVADPVTAQTVLDGEVNNKVVVLKEGTYGQLQLRPSKTTSTFFKHNYLGGTSPDLQVGDSVTLDYVLEHPDVPYHYFRKFENVKIVGEDGVTFTDSIMLNSTHVYGSTHTYGFVKYDQVREILNPTTNNSHYPHISVENLSFENLNFSGKQALINLYFAIADSSADGITIKNCNFTTEEANTIAAMCFRGEFNVYNNIVVEDCEVDGHFQGVLTYNAKNVTVKNNKIANTSHNAIAIQSHSAATCFVSGKIVIEDNSISNVIGSYIEGGNYAIDGQRAMRIGKCTDVEIVVKNNNISNCYEQWIVTGALTGTVSYNFENNYYKGTKMDGKSASSEDADFVQGSTVILYTPEKQAN